MLGTIVAALAILSFVALCSQVVAYVRSTKK